LNPLKKKHWIAIRMKPEGEEIWKRAVLEKAVKCGKIWSEVNRLAGNTIRWRCFTNFICL